MTKEYIGDGVYARMDDYGGIWLTTENGISTTNQICLEPAVYETLRRFHDNAVAEKKHENEER